MFSPIPVAADEADKVYTYFLQAVGREVQSDEVSLSITLWGGSEGAAETIPGDPYSPPTPYVFPHYNHWHTWNTFNFGFQGTDYLWDSRWALTQVLEGYTIPANQWSLGVWWKPDVTYFSAQQEFPNTYPGIMMLYQRRSLRHDSPEFDPGRNAIRWTFSVRLRDPSEWGDGWDGLDHVHQMDVKVESALGVDVHDVIPEQDKDITFSVRALIMDDAKGTSALMPWSTNFPNPRQNDGWYFTVVCYEGTFDDSPQSKPAMRMWHNMGIATDEEDDFNDPDPIFHVQGMRNVQIIAESFFQGNPTGRSPMYMSQAFSLSEKIVIQDDSQDRLEGFGVAVHQLHHSGKYLGSSQNAEAYAASWHQAGMWSVALDNWNGYTYSQGEGQAAINYLYNQGYGTEIDWKVNSASEGQPSGSSFQAYLTSENLNSLWQFGAVESEFYLHEALRDTGYHLYGGGLNMSTEIFPHDPGFESDSPLRPDYGPNSWGNTAGIWDVRSPGGTNGTTQSDICYPGQNL
jgi:hypothetical protein